MTSRRPHERVEDDLDLPELTERLARDLSPADLASLLIEAYRRRAEARTPAQVLASYESDRFARPGRVSIEDELAFERLAVDLLPEGFETVTLSPVTPLGTCSAVADVDPSWAVPTVRNTEVVSDCTNVLALEAAVRRRELLRADSRSKAPVHLATRHRLVRPQLFDRPDFAAHFSIFALCSAGRDSGDARFELASAAEHLRFHVGLLRSYAGPSVPLRASATPLGPTVDRALLEERLLAPLADELPDVTVEVDLKRTRGRTYYRELCFQVEADGPSGERLNMADGGTVDWTQKLLSNRKERLVVSGVGSQRCVERLGGKA